MLAQQQELLAFGLREKLQIHRRTRSVSLSSKDPLKQLIGNSRRHPVHHPTWSARGKLQTKLRPAGPRQFHQEAVKFRVTRFEFTPRVPRRDTRRGALGVADECLVALREVLIFVRRPVIVKRCLLYTSPSPRD